MCRAIASAASGAHPAISAMRSPVEPDAPPNAATSPSPRRRLARYLPLAGLVVVAVAAWLGGLPRELAPAELARHTAALRAEAAAAPAASLGGFILAYAALTGALLPVALMMSLLGGVVFGPWIGGVGVLLGATGGALLTYAATRSAFAHVLVARAERDPRLQRILDGFGRDAFAHVLTLRLVPFFPFALVNVACGLAAISLKRYAAATVLGGAPAALIYASLGSGLGRSLASERSLMQAVEAPEVIVPLFALAALSAAPAIVRRVRRRAAP
jgi:uncharacterized membrane protein YdjX (TVP38/TMEM64 family)